jgi:aminopeptidase N
MIELLQPLTFRRARGALRPAMFLLLLLPAAFGCHSTTGTAPITGRAPESVLTVLDSRTGSGLEGALVYSRVARRAYRTDVHGRVSVPRAVARGGLEVFARGFHERHVEVGALAVDVLLEHDAAGVTAAEARLSFTRADTLRGRYGAYRANNDVLTYDLDVVVDVERKFIRGRNLIRFRMLEDASRIQLDLFDNMAVDLILLGDREVSYTRDGNAVFVDFGQVLRRGETYALDFHYSGNPVTRGRFGGVNFQQDSLGNPWIYTANQGIGASLWWPNKDQQPDEVDSMTIRITVPRGLTAVSNGRFQGSTDIGNGQVRFDWKVHYPINNYSVSMNIGDYRHFGEQLGDLTLDYHVMPYHMEAAQRQFAQVKPMMECFERYFGPYPFPRDGYKLIEVPYSGMEHQSAVTYGNLFQNGYLGRDWTGVGVSLWFDFIIIHESGHEWFGNSVSANDFSEAWIHEGWGTWAEAVYVECMFGYDDAIRYINGYQEKVRHERPIIGPPGVNYWGDNDQYFKGALFLNTLRHVIGDDDFWWDAVRGFVQHFEHSNIWTVDVINFFNERLERATRGGVEPRDVRPLFQQYLYHTQLPVLEVRIQGDSVHYRWQAQVDDFDMPVRVRVPGGTRTIHPVTEWRAEPLHGISPDQWQPATDLFYIEVRRH